MNKPTPSRDQLRDRLVTLRLHGLHDHLDELGDAELPTLARWLDWEERARGDRGLARRLSAAHLGRFKPMADFDWSWPTSCDRDAINELFTLDFVSAPSNIVLVGPNGVGKSTIAQNLAQRAVLAGHSALFVTAADCLSDLAVRDSDAALRRRLKRYINAQVLVLDEIGYLAYAARQADLLFEIVSQRYEAKPIIVTTNRPFSEWSEVFPNAACVVSLIDRLCHHSDIIAIDGESYRRREAHEQAAAKKAAAKAKRTARKRS